MDPIFEDRLKEIGDWIDINGDAIYATRPWSICQNETAHDVFYTVKGDILYAIMRTWPEDDKLRLTCPLATAQTSARLLGVDSQKNSVLWQSKSDSKTGKDARGLQSQKLGNGLELDLPNLNPTTIPCDHAWVLELKGIGNLP